MFSGFKNVDQNQIYLVTNNTWNTQVYSGLEFTVAKRTSRLNMIAGYTRGWQHLDGTWVPNDPASIVQPGAFANDQGIGTIRGDDGRDYFFHCIAIAGGARTIDEGTEVVHRECFTFRAPWRWVLEPYARGWLTQDTREEMARMKLLLERTT